MTVYMPAPQRPVGSRYTLDAEGSGLGSRQRLLARMPPRCTGDCNTELHFGLFFDGTNNNKDRDFEKNPPAHSNVARLYDVFDHSQAENKRRYIPGVGTKAVNEVGDSGVGREHVAGAGAGWGGDYPRGRSYPHHLPGRNQGARQSEGVPRPRPNALPAAAVS